MSKDEEVLQKLKPLIAEVLAIDAERIRPEHVLVSDFGAESIDLLDLSFRIEDAFKVTIQADEMEREARKRLGDMPYEKDGFLTEEALAEIRRSLPELDQSKLIKGLRRSNLPSMLTVGFFVRLIARKLDEKTGVPAHA
jgi:acyl carrier protein